MKRNIFPSISVVMPTYDGSYEILDRCLSLVRSQNYPQENIEIVLGHGGSKDKISSIAKKFKAKVYIIPSSKQNAEYNRGVAFNHATKDLVLILDSDNYIPYKNWLRDMVLPFLENQDLVASETCFYHYEKSFGILDRYFALWGTSEPLPYYLHKADRMPWGTKSWTLLGKAQDKGKYYLVEFEPDPRKFPTMGTNACLMDRKLVSKNADVRPDYHYPIDVMFDVVKSGHNKFAFVKNSIVHNTGYVGFLTFLKRRYKFVEEYHFKDRSKRRYSVYMKGDLLKVAWFVLISITFIKPTLDAIKGYKRIPDMAWFLQPVMSFFTVVIYTYTVIRNLFSNFIKE